MKLIISKMNGNVKKEVIRSMINIKYFCDKNRLCRLS